MFNELILICTQFGGGPGDPANNVVRFLLAAFFWLVLLVVSFRMWQSSADRRHLLFSCSALIGVSRELFMFTVEYGSFRGYLSFEQVFRYYPPIEHTVETLAIIMMGFAFLRFYFNYERFSRWYLVVSSVITLLAFIVIAPMWIRFLDASAERAAIDNAPFIGATFHSFPGDLTYRIIGVLVTVFVLAAFLYARSKTIRIPWLAFCAFFLFFLDHGLQAVNDLLDDRYAPIFGPLRHCLHTIAIAQMVGGYWWEITNKLDSRELFLQTLLDAIPDHIYFKKTDGRFVGCNQTFAERFVGRSKDEIIGRRYSDVLADRELAEVLDRSDRAVLDSGQALRFESSVTLADGSHALMETINTPYVDSHGEKSGIIGVARDISDRKALEDQLRYSQKMDAIGQLAGGVAHDFNNVMTAIIGYASLLKFTLPPDTQQVALVESILSSSDRATKLVRNLMSFSRRETLTASTIDLNVIVGNMHDFLKQILTEDIQLSVVCSQSSLPVYVDSSQIGQVLTNLVANGRDAMLRGGSLKITTQSCYLGDTFVREKGIGKAGQYALLTVTDNGTGMDEVTCARIFEPFFTTKEVGKGTGLGLAIVYGIIKQHNGIIDVESTPGVGSTFRIYLPIVAEVPVRVEENSETLQFPRGTETILVVEDDPAVRLSVESNLRLFGYWVLSARDGEEAVRKFTEKADEISLVLMDIIMPVMNGKEAADRIRALRPGTRILFTSGYTADIIRSRGELEEGEELLLKPVAPGELLRRIRQMLDNNVS